MHFINEIQFIELQDEYFMINLINGASDIINTEIYDKIVSKKFEQIDVNIIEQLLDRKYLFRTINEYDNFILEIENKIEAIEENSVPNFLIVPTYVCNLECIYCYEQTYMIKGTSLTSQFKLIDKQVDIIDKIVRDYKIKNNGLENYRIRITIMGGEPLLKTNYSTIEYILQTCRVRDYSIDIVTNGVDLNHFIDLLARYNINHIQITLDGTEKIHDKRRKFRNGRGSFGLILNNIQLALENNIPIYLRANVDMSNIDNLPELADVLVNKFKGNKNLKPYIYLLQDGGCSGDRNILNEKIGIEKIFELENKYPNLEIFYKKFHSAEFIECIFKNMPYQPLLRHCGAAKNQYIFDCKGNVYRCWHGIGNNSYRVGVFEPEYKMEERKNQLWKERSIRHIDKCINCKYRYICGTGCPAASHETQNMIDITKPSCVDYEKVIETIVINHINKHGI